MTSLDQMTVDLTRRFPVPLSALYRLCASPSFFKRTGAKPDSGHMDFRVGGAYRYVFDNGSQVWGEYTEIVPNERIVLTWSTDHPDGPCENTTVRLGFKALGSESELHLVHDGFADAKGYRSHDDGWKEIFDGLAGEFTGQLGAAIRAGLEPRFKIPQRFNVPVAQVFNAFVSEEQITKFFVASTTGPLRQGECVQWRFESHDHPFNVFCHELVPNKLIRFTWGNAHVTFDFEDLGQQSRLTITCEGFEPTQEGLADSYSECEGWRHVTMSLRLQLEHGISFDTPECSTQGK